MLHYMNNVQYVHGDVTWKSTCRLYLIVTSGLRSSPHRPPAFEPRDRSLPAVREVQGMQMGWEWVAIPLGIVTCSYLLIHLPLTCSVRDGPPWEPDLCTSRGAESPEAGGCRRSRRKRARCQSSSAGCRRRGQAGLASGCPFFLPGGPPGTPSCWRIRI